MPAAERPSGAPIAVVGITDLGAASLTADARTLVERAEVICGGERHLAFFPEHPAERVTIKARIDDLVERLRKEMRRVVVLASGDPSCYGIGPVLAERLGYDRVCIVPNVSAVQLAFARLGLSWHDAAVLSAHGRPLDSILPAAQFARKVAILTDGRNTPSAIAGALLAAGVAGDTRAHVFEHIGGTHERHVERALGELEGQEFATLNILVIPDAGRRQPWRLGLPEEAFAHRRGLITKAELRAVTLSKLRLHEDDVLWDVGAGCGSVSIEASGLLRSGQVYAVERDAEQLDYLAENRRCFGAGNLTIVAGEAPSVLATLPAPDVVFVGGSGGELGSIVAVALDHLTPGGRLVANMVSLEHVGELLACARSHAWEAEVAQIGVARSTTTAGLTRLAALNPTFVVTLSPTMRGSP